MERPVSFLLNGNPTSVTTDYERILLWILRSDLALTGTKFGCGEGLCSACTVVVDGQAVRSCVTPLREVAGKQVTTIEGLGVHRLHAGASVTYARLVEGRRIEKHLSNDPRIIQLSARMTF